MQFPSPWRPSASSSIKRARANLKQRAEAGELQPRKYQPAERAGWPEAVKSFAEGGREKAFALAGEEGNRLDYLVRRGARDLGLFGQPRGRRIWSA